MNENVKSALYPLLLLAALLRLWTVAVRSWGVPHYILPPLENVLAALYRGYIEGAYWKDFGYTLTSMLVGYVGGCSLAFVVGVLFTEYRWLERLLYPFVLGFPVDAEGGAGTPDPCVVWIWARLKGGDGRSGLLFPDVHQYGRWPEVDGFIAAGSDARVLREPLAYLTRIKIPSAASHIFAGLQISIVLGLIGAVVAEFVSSSQGLGFLINAATTTLDTGTMFAALISLAVLGISGSQIIKLLQRKLVFWDRGAKLRPSPSEAKRIELPREAADR